MPSLLSRLYHRLGVGYFWLFVALEVVWALVVCLATVGMFRLYTEMSASEFWTVTLVAEVCTLVAVLNIGVRVWKRARPVRDWMRDGGDADAAAEAWLAAVTLPRRLLARNGWQPFLIVGLPVSAFVTLHFGLPAYSALIVFGGAAVAVAYVAILHFFVTEQFMRPVLIDLAAHLPGHLVPVHAGVPLRWKLLGALPIVNVITGVVVSGLSTDGTASLEDLGLDVVVAVLVAFTISLELTVLITRSVLGPVDELLAATKAAGAGDMDARVAITSSDELGELGASFNQMMQGLSEREVLRGALGSYVDPDVAKRVLEEGEMLEGQEREVTVMFVDVRDFTPRAERLSARETVTFLNEFFDTVVPVVLEHGGHANKFLGDGVLAVFGAPDRLPDHADRAVACARAIGAAVRERFRGDVRVGIGLNSGPVVVGSVGGGGRLEFTVIGDTVNISARAERFTRDTGDEVLVTEATHALLTRGREQLVARGEIELKGISARVALYALASPVDERFTPPARPLVADA